MNKYYYLLILLFFSFIREGSAQSISGTFSTSPNQSIKLEGFKGFESYLISNAESDENGTFTLNYASSNVGVGYLIINGGKPNVVILSGENIELVNSDGNGQSIEVAHGQENQWFQQYAVEHPSREQVLSAWTYLEKIYENEPLYAKERSPYNLILKEKKRIQEEDQAFLETLPPESYVSWYLPTRALISSVSTVAQYRTDEISSIIAALRKLDYSDHRLYKSGLLKDAIESHYWLIENSGISLDSVYVEMNKSTDQLLASLVGDEAKYNEIGEYLFEFLESRSLFKASEYLALKMLTDNACTLENDVANLLETYRAMKKGNTAPDIDFSGVWLRDGLAANDLPEKLSQLNTGHKLMVFGSSWCPTCVDDIPKIAALYPKWKDQNVEVVFISLDETEDEFKEFVSDFPFLSHCDYKKWESPVVKDYYVFGTPTMFLLDGNNKIVLRPNSVRQVDAWVDWYLAKDHN